MICYNKPQWNIYYVIILYHIMLNHIKSYYIKLFYIILYHMISNLIIIILNCIMSYFNIYCIYIYTHNSKYIYIYISTKLVRHQGHILTNNIYPFTFQTEMPISICVCKPLSNIYCYPIIG